MGLNYLIRHSESKKDSPSIFLLHGYGSNKEDLFSLEGFLPKNHTVISLEAPILLPFGGFTWFDVDQADLINKSYITPIIVKSQNRKLNSNPRRNPYAASLKPYC